MQLELLARVRLQVFKWGMVVSTCTCSTDDSCPPSQLYSGHFLYTWKLQNGGEIYILCFERHWILFALICYVHSAEWTLWMPRVCNHERYCCAELLGLREFSIKWKRIGKMRSWHYTFKECLMDCSGRGQGHWNSAHSSGRPRWAW